MGGWSGLLDALVDAVEEHHLRFDDGVLEDTLLFSAELDLDLIGQHPLEHWLSTLGVSLPVLDDDPPDDGDGDGNGDDDDDDDGILPIALDDESSPTDDAEPDHEPARRRTAVPARRGRAARERTRDPERERERTRVPARRGRATRGRTRDPERERTRVPARRGGEGRGRERDGDAVVRDHRRGGDGHAGRIIDDVKDRIRNALEDLVSDGSDPTELAGEDLDLSIVWRVVDEAERTLYATDDRGRPASGSGADGIEHLSEGQPAVLDLLFEPEVARAGGGARSAERTVQAVVSLAGPDDGVERTIGLPIELSALELPRLLALFVETGFNQGATDKGVLFLLPDNSVGDLTGLNSLLEGLGEHLGTLTVPLRRLSGTSAIAARMLARLAGVEALLTLLGQARAGDKAHRRVQVRATSGIRRLRKVRFRTKTSVALGRSDATAKNSISSLILFGPPGTTAELFNASRYDEKRGQLNVETGSLCITGIDDLHAAEPDVYTSWADWTEMPRETATSGGAETEAGPTGSRTVRYWRDVTSFGDELSSVRFTR